MPTPPRLDEAAVALVTASLTGVPESVLTAIVAEVDSDDLAVYLAGVVALAVRETAGGRQWLRRWGLAAAEAVR